MGLGLTTQQLAELGINAPSVTEDFGTFDTRKRHSDVIREGQDTDILQDAGDWMGDVWQNNITQVPEEESGISNTGAPEDMQGVLAHVPNDSKPYAIKQALKNFFPDATAGGHSFDVFQDENSGKWVYTDPNTAKPTWIEPPGIEVGDWGDDGAVMALETVGSGIGGGLGLYFGGPPGMYAGAATGSGIATGGYTYSELQDLLEQGYLDPEIYGTPAHPNESALRGESGTQAAISAGGSLVGDTVIHAGKQGFKNLAQTKAFRVTFPKQADRYLIQDSLNQAIKMQKGDFPLFSESDWPLQSTASILKALVRRQRIAIGDKVLSTSANKAATEAEGQAVTTASKDVIGKSVDDNSATFDNMGDEQALALEQLGLTDSGSLDAIKVDRLGRLSTNMEQLESSALNWKNADLLREKHQLRIENIHQRYTDMLKESGLSDNAVRTLGEQYLKQANNDIYGYLGERRIYNSDEFGKDVTKTADDLSALVDDFIKFTSDPAKANSSVKSAFGTAESHLDARVNQAYLDVLGNDFNPKTPMFDASEIQGDVLAQILKLPKLFPELSGDTTFIKNLYRNLYDAKGNPRKLSWDSLDTEIKTLRGLKRAVWNAPTDKINKQTLLDIEEGLLSWRYNTLKGTNGEEVLARLNDADRLTRDAHATFDSRVVSSLVGDDTPIKEDKLFSLLTSNNIGNEDVFYIKNLMDSFIGTPTGSTGPRTLSSIDKKDGQDLYNAVRDAFYNNYRKKVLKETSLGEPMQLIGVDKKVVMSKEAAHEDWMNTHSEYLSKWLDPEDLASFQNAGDLSAKLRAESAVLKDIASTSGMKNKNTVFQATYGPGADKYSATEDIWTVMHNADGSPKPGAENYIKQYQRMIFNDMNDKILQTNLKKDPNITGHAFVDFQSIDNYIRKHEDSMMLWLGPDKMREVREIRGLAELATTWRTRHMDDSNNQLSKMMNDGLRAYVGMFTRTGRMLTAVKRFKGRDEDKAIMQSLLDGEVAAKRMNHLDRSRIMVMMNAIGPKPAGRAMERDPVDESNVSDTVSGAPQPAETPTYDFNWDKINQANQKMKNGGVVHDYQLPTLNRPERVDDMMGEGIKEALQQVEALRATGREQEAAELERNIERLMMESNQGQDMQMPGQDKDEFLGQYWDRELAGLERTAEEGNGYAEGGYVTQDQMQGMMQQMSGVQPTLQATPVIPPLQEEPTTGAEMMGVGSGVMSIKEQYAPALTKKQKEKAKVKAIKKGNKRRTSTPPPTTGILSGF